MTKWKVPFERETQGSGAAISEPNTSEAATSLANAYSVLSKQVALLVDAGFVDVQKGYAGKRPRTWLQLTPRGHAAFVRHLDALRDIANGGPR
ncbi:transcriptional regulator [Agromyces cerinus subsp. nitratus]|uniref:transcriptional regulator n=1 Tax=Agromyces cerinus TaxID=33878 RepID=UPI001959D424|nr:transcriptional regulator [Agromyces cerinus]